jgi:hypothetical protein
VEIANGHDTGKRHETGHRRAQQLAHKGWQQRAQLVESTRALNRPADKNQHQLKRGQQHAGSQNQGPHALERMDH